MFDLKIAKKIIINYTDAINDIINTAKNVIRSGENFAMTENGSYIYVVVDNRHNNETPVSGTVGFKYFKEYGELCIIKNMVYIDYSYKVSNELTGYYKGISIEDCGDTLITDLKQDIIVPKVHEDRESSDTIYVVKQSELNFMLDLIDTADDIINDIKKCTTETKNKLDKLK